jgi:MoxR-like ATPase
MSSTQARIAALPIRTVFDAFAALHGGATPSATKAEAARQLARAVESGRVSIRWVEAGGAGGLMPAPAPAPSAAPPSLAGPSLAAVQAVAERAERASVQTATDLVSLAQSASALGQSVQGIGQAVNTLSGSLGSLTGDVQALRSEVKAARSTRLDPSEFRSEVAAAVAATLSPLLPNLAPEVAAEVVRQTAAPVSRVPALQAFGIDARDARGNPLEFDFWGHPEAPPVDPAFIWTEAILRRLFLAQQTGRNAWLGGPAGTGKSQTIEQWAARTGRMMRRFVFNRLSTCEDYLGAPGLTNGSTVFKPGPVLDVYTTPGAVCLLDEVGVANPGALSALNGFLEPGARMAYADRVWLRASSNLFFAADNSLTQGDQTGRFAGVQQMNTAFADRFAFVVPFSYLDPGVEAQALMQHTGCTRPLADHVVSILSMCRAKVDAGDIIDPPSIRQAIAFIQACSVLPVDEAWQVTIAARQPAESQVGLGAVYASAVSVSLIQQEV